MELGTTYTLAVLIHHCIRFFTLLMGINNFNKLHLVPVLQLVMGQVQLPDMSAESSDPHLVSCLADAAVI